MATGEVHPPAFREVLLTVKVKLAIPIDVPLAELNSVGTAALDGIDARVNSSNVARSRGGFEIKELS